MDDRGATAVTDRQLLEELAEHLEAAAATVRRLAGPTEPAATAEVDEWAMDASAGDPLLSLSPADWITVAAQLHPALGPRQMEVLGEVAKAHPDGTGTGPIWKAIGYEQTNTYLALDALARQGLVRKDATAKPHRYYLGDTLIEFAWKAYGYDAK